MHDWTRAAITLAALLLLATPASAQWEPNYELSLQGGYDHTLDTLGEATDGGFGLGTSLGYRMSPDFIVGADFHLNSYSVADEVTAGILGEMNVSMALYEFAAFAKHYVGSGNYRFYGKGGAGLFYGRSKVSYQGQEYVGDSYDPGMSASIGFQIEGRRNSATFFEASYRRVLGDDVHWFGFSVGANFFVW